jgi:hypothetical protein
LRKDKLIAACIAVFCFSTVVALQFVGPPEEQPKDFDQLVIEGRVITAVKIDGARCILATHTYGNGSSTALSCDFTHARP